MKKEYITPEAELIALYPAKDVLTVSDPEGVLPSQGTIEGPGSPDDDF